MLRWLYLITGLRVEVFNCSLGEYVMTAGLTRTNSGSVE